MIGVVLAGGRSSRMGQDKALLSYKNNSLLDHAVSLLNRAGIETVYISGQRENYTCIPDLSPGCGPVGAIYSVARYLRSRVDLHRSNLYCLFIPVDMPLLTTSTLKALIDSKLASRAVCFEGYPFPLIVSINEFTYQLLNKMMTQKVSNNMSVKHLLSEIGAHCLPTLAHNTSAFTNINTKEAYAKLDEVWHCHESNE